jgi:hypothetical protein
MVGCRLSVVGLTTYDALIWYFTRISRMVCDTRLSRLASLHCVYNLERQYYSKVIATEAADT